MAVSSHSHSQQHHAVINLHSMGLNIMPVEELEANPNAREIRASKNKILKIPQMGQQCPSLEILNMSYNRIVKIENLDHLPKLRTLILNDNSISLLEAMDNLPSLEVLDVSGNHLNRICGVAHCRNLKVLKLARNNITCLGDLRSCTKLGTLDITENHIRTLSDVPNCLPSSLTKFLMANNDVDELQELSFLTCLDKLQVITVRDNPLCRMPINYRAFLAFLLRSTLTTLDDKQVSKSESVISKRLFTDRSGELSDKLLELLTPIPSCKNDLYTYLKDVCSSQPSTPVLESSRNPHQSAPPMSLGHPLNERRDPITHAVTTQHSRESQVLGMARGSTYEGHEGMSRHRQSQPQAVRKTSRTRHVRDLSDVHTSSGATVKSSHRKGSGSSSYTRFHEMAAVGIQAHIRGALVRTRMAKLGRRRHPHAGTTTPPKTYLGHGHSRQSPATVAIVDELKNVRLMVEEEKRLRVLNEKATRVLWDELKELRLWIDKRLVEDERRAAITIQTRWRSTRDQKIYRSIRDIFRKRKAEKSEAALFIQSRARGWLQRRRFRALLAENDAATTIQSRVRCFLAMKEFSKELYWHRRCGRLEQQVSYLLRQVSHLQAEGLGRSGAVEAADQSAFSDTKHSVILDDSMEGDKSTEAVTTPAAHADEWSIFYVDVKVVSGESLRLPHNKTSIHPFCVISLGSQHHKTGVRTDEVSPVWNERCSFVGHSPKDTLTIQLMDWSDGLLLEEETLSLSQLAKGLNTLVIALGGDERNGLLKLEVNLSDSVVPRH